MEPERRRKELRFVLIAWALMVLAHTVTVFADSPNTDNLPSPLLFEGNLPLLSDFEGDHKVDQAILVSNAGLKTIYIAFGNSSWKSLSFDSGEDDRGELVSADVDHDGDIDLVWIAQRARRFITWLGDGHGHFAISTVERHGWIEVFLINAGTQLAGGSSGRDHAVIVLGGSLFLCRRVRYHTPLSLQAALTIAETRFYDSTSRSLHKLRGPPLSLPL